MTSTICYDLLADIVAEQPYRLLFATISGAHLYGFPSVDSDFDLRGAHMLPLREVIGLGSPQETIESCQDREGREIDLVTHDAKKFFSLMIKPNGYVLEQLCSPLVVHTTAEHAELKSLAGACITRQHAHHYLGFARSQWRLFEKDEPRRIKPLLYVYRVLLTGVHLMCAGEIEADVTKLNQSFRLPQIDELVAAKTEGHERCTLEASDLAFHEREYQRLLGVLSEAYEQSKLPEAPTCRDALDDLLRRLRLESDEV